MGGADAVIQAMLVSSDEALLVEEMLEALFPLTYRAFVENRRVAP